MVESEPTGWRGHARTCLLSIHDAPEGSMPCTCGGVESGADERMSDVTLTEFLLARIGEDEVSAERMARAVAAGLYGRSGYHQSVQTYLSAMSPARVLDRCAADRAIIASTERAMRLGTNGLGPSVLRALALPYADHPDYDEAWRP